ncbi:MAG: ABC transporter ATP-binding protein [Clostridia bacterium]|nr:ABC transporter ATP-binding protein [Clostridia bacterium]
MKVWLKTLADGWQRAKQFSRGRRSKSAKEILGVFQAPIRASMLPLLGGLALLLVASVADVVAPKLQELVVDSVIARNSFRETLLYGGAVAVLVLLGLLFHTLSDFQIHRAENKLILKVQTQVFNHLLALPKSYFDGQEKDGIINRVSADIYGMRSVLSVVLLQLCGRVPVLLVSAVLLVLKHPVVGLWSLLPVPIFFGLSYVIGRRTRALAYLAAEERAGVYGVIAESVKGSTLIKTDGEQSGQVEKLEHRGEQNRKIVLEQRAYGSLMRLLGGLFQHGSKLIVFGLGFYMMYKGELTLGGVVAMSTYLGMVYNPAQAIARGILTLQEGLTSLERVSEFYEVQPEDVHSGEQVAALKGEVAFANVAFSYGQEPVLEGVTFSLAPGRTHYLIGESGVGKSTLLSLMLCLYRPKSGSIFFDGKEQSVYALESLRRRIAYLSQETVFFSGTVYQNLAAQTGADKESVVAAAKTARIHDRIMTLEQGYDTPLESGALIFSQGERQRLSLARALVRNADVYIVDEPTAALDPHNRDEVLSVLHALAQEKTVLIVTHQTEQIPKDAHVLVLDEGRVSDETGV